jgi:hypothetical protein
MPNEKGKASNVSFIPVDHDPFALTPIDHDPFVK